MLRRVGVTLALVLSVAACGSSATSTPSQVLSPTTTQGGTCGAGNLTAKVIDAGDGAAATRYLSIQLTNTGASSCATGGYFAVSSYGVDGKVVVAQNDHVAPSAAPVTLAPGGALKFTVGIDDLPSGTQGTCPRVATLRLTAPNTTGSIPVALLDAQGQGTQVVECPGAISVTAATSS